MQHSVRLFVAGVDTAHYFASVDGFHRRVSRHEIRRGEIVPQLEKMVERGRLNETAAPELAEELIACVLTSEKFFAGFVDPRRSACAIQLILLK